MICTAYILLRVILLTAIGILFYHICKKDNALGKIKNKKLVYGFKISFSAGSFIIFLSVAAYIFANLANNADYNSCSLNIQSEYLKMFLGFPSNFANAKGYFGILQYILHLFISFLISFGTWKIKMWPAGDAKLFLLSSAILPILLPKPSYYPLTLSLSLLQNILIPSATVFIFESFVSIIRKSYIFVAKNDTTNFFNNIKMSATTKIKGSEITEKTGLIFAFIAFYYIRQILRTALSIDTPAFLILMFIVWKPIGMFLRENKTFVLFLIVFFIAAALMIGDISKLAIAGIYGTAACIPFLVLRSSIMWMMKNDSIRNIPISEIKEGTVLTEKYLNIIKKTKPVFFEQTFKYIYPDGLTNVQAEKLKSLLSSCNDSKLKEAQSYASKPFSVWITTGLAITILLNGETVITLCKFIYQTIKYHL